MDLCGPLPEASLGGSLYFLLLVDDYSRFCWGFFLQQKSEAFRSFSQWFPLAQNESGHTLKTLRSDKGGEFTSHDMSQFCSQHGIQQEFANTSTPSENGVVERKNKTILEMARSMLTHHSLSPSLWAEVVAIDVHVFNRSPTQAVLQRTPFEAYFG